MDTATDEDCIGREDCPRNSGQLRFQRRGHPSDIVTNPEPLTLSICTVDGPGPPGTGVCPLQTHASRDTLHDTIARFLFYSRQAYYNAPVVLFSYRFSYITTNLHRSVLFCPYRIILHWTYPPPLAPYQKDDTRYTGRTPHLDDIPSLGQRSIYPILRFMWLHAHLRIRVQSSLI
jgi:hypothetical protein